jgi:DNA (cytosine-5)-methyltransferase 1
MAIRGSAFGPKCPSQGGWHWPNTGFMGECRIGWPPANGCRIPAFQCHTRSATCRGAAKSSGLMTEDGIRMRHTAVIYSTNIWGERWCPGRTAPFVGPACEHPVAQRARAGCVASADLPPQGIQVKFIDLFSGCGGLSLGLTQAGMSGVFAVERDAMAFRTFAANFVDASAGSSKPFDWPEWLQKKAWGIDDLLDLHGKELVGLRGSIQVIAGGPPCQGFSTAGRRNEDDPRNQMFLRYAKVVDAVRPLGLILENVPGMKIAHAKKSLDAVTSKGSESYYEKAKATLEAIGYDVLGQVLHADRFGVPQRRPRLIVIGIRRDLAFFLKGGASRVFELIEEQRKSHLAELGLGETVSAADAISDLEISGHGMTTCLDEDSPKGFSEIVYGSPSTSYQRLMHAGHDGKPMNSMRLARHRENVSQRFSEILAAAPRGVRMNEALRERFGLRKHRIFPMAAGDPAPTMTTLPDDVLHYGAPRILTVRETARLQSFPDWFRFLGKYTTGGDRRTKECPRYTQVGNAVPPLLALAIGRAVKAAIAEAEAALQVHSAKVRQKANLQPA